MAFDVLLAAAFGRTREFALQSFNCRRIGGVVGQIGFVLRIDDRLDRLHVFLPRCDAPRELIALRSLETVMNGILVVKKRGQPIISCLPEGCDIQGPSENGLKEPRSRDG